MFNHIIIIQLSIDFKCDIDDQQLFNFTPYILKHISVASTPFILRTDSLL